MNKPSNPFTVISPERLSGDKAKELFVSMFTDFPEIESDGNTIMFGARGSGKSMLLRCLLPDVILNKGSQINELKFLPFLISIKNTELRITELDALDRQSGAYMINENFLTLTILIEILGWLKDCHDIKIPFNPENYKTFHEDIYQKSLRYCRYRGEVECKLDSANKYFQTLYDHALTEMHSNFKDYILNLPTVYNDNLPKYELPLLDFRKLLCPFLKGIRNLFGLEQKYIYLFIDDADNLSRTQTQVLNSWILARTQPEISIKISSQVGQYKSFVASNKVLVEAPHDYREVRISERYTNSKNIYYKRVEEIIGKRLKLANFSIDNVQDYFPPNIEQENKIYEEAERLKSDWEKSGRGYRPSDDALRYARPNYIKNLGGCSKSRSTYSYSGFDQLVNLSSGVIRNFLDAASTMYDEETDNNVLRYISPSIQNKVMKDKAETKMFSEFPKLEKDFAPHSGEKGKAQKLQNLVFAMGKTFHEILVSDLSERRVFSIALTNIPDVEIKEVLDFGVLTGYFHEASVGNKDGTGKTWLYILNRMLAPQFTLDPNGFAGYLFVTNNALKKAMHSGSLLREFTSNEQPEQFELFD